MVGHASRGSLVQELGRVNHWWTDERWSESDPQLVAAAAAPYRRNPSVLDDIEPPNLYVLRGPRRVGKSTVIKQNIARLLASGVDPHCVCYFSADSILTRRDLINMFQSARQLFPDTASSPRYFFVDEISAVADWEQALKWVRDNTPIAGDCVVVTGSSSGDVAAGAYHLAGRRGSALNLDRLLMPMSFPEFVNCAGYRLPPSPALPLAEFYAETGRQCCRRHLAHLGTLVDAMDAYFVVGGFPQAVSAFRRTASVPSGFARDLWDVIRSDLHRLGVSRPEHILLLMEQIASSITAPISMRTIADSLAIDPRTVGSWIDALANAYLVLALFQQEGGVPKVNGQRKVYPIDPIVARLPSLSSPGISQPSPSQMSELVATLALFRSIGGIADDSFALPRRLFYHKTPGNKEIDFLVLPEQLAAESKYIETPDRRELRTMQSAFGEGLLLTRDAIDIQANGTILPLSLFAWMLDQRE